MSMPAQPFFTTDAQRARLARQRFFDEGLRPTGLVGEAVIQSWNRCLGQRRSPSEAVCFEPVSAARAQTAVMRSRDLLDAVRDELQQLQAAVAGSACRVIMTDAQGVVVHAGQVRGSAQECVLPVAARVGVKLAEGAIGTNAPGLVVHSGRACTVTGAEHFFDVVRGMRCAAAPVRDAAGRLVAVLDLSVENRPFGFDAASIVAVYASAIENRWLVAQARDQLVLQFQASPALLGTPLEALAAVGHDGGVHWLNAAARRLLANDAVGASAESVFGLDAAGLLAMTGRDAATLLHMPSGLSVWLRARLRARDGLVHAASVPTPTPTPAPAPPAAPTPTAEPTAAPELALAPAPAPPPPTPPAVVVSPGRTLAEHDQAYISSMLAACGGNVAAAARRLGVSRGLLYRRLKSRSQG